jgi:hypothetical protein
MAYNYSKTNSALTSITRFTRNNLLTVISAVIALSVAVLLVTSTNANRTKSAALHSQNNATNPERSKDSASAAPALFALKGGSTVAEDEGLLFHHRPGTNHSLLNFLAPVVTATKTDALFTDVDNDNAADPGDTLKYSVTISASGEDATGVTFTDTVDPNTAFVGGSLTATPVAVNDSYTAIGNVRISVPAGSGVLANDFAGLPAATITGAPALSANGGDVAVAADGSFTYNPPPGFEGSDSFTYTLTNSEGSNNATVNITVSGMIWFVSDVASCPCDGRLTNPFLDLSGAGNTFDAVAADDPGDNIFLYTGVYTGGLTLLANQRLIGQGASASLSSITGVTPPSYSDPLPATGGARPGVENAAGSNILLTSGNYLRGFDIGNSATSGSAISGGMFGTLTVTELAIAGTGRALNLNNGTLGATIDSISSSNSTTQGIFLNSVGGTFSVTGATTVTNATQEGIKISNVSNIGSPSLQFDGTTISSRNATGILLDNVDNSSGTMSFGAVSIPNPNNAGGYGIRVQNSSAAVTVASATISDANLVSAQTDAGADGIPDTDGDGDAIFLTNNPGSFTLSGGSLSNCGNDCIDLRDSSNLVLSNVNISNPGLDVTSATGAGFGGHGISAINLTGTSSITGGTISGFNTGSRDGLYSVNTVSTALGLTIQGTTFQNATGNRGIGVSGRNAANMSVTVGGPTNNVATNVTFSNIQATALQTVAGVGAGSTATVNLTVQNSTFQNSAAGGKTNLLASVTEAGKSTVVIQDNTFSNVYRTASSGEGLINVNNSATLAGNQLDLTIQRNNINGVGIAGSIGPTSTILVLLNNQANVPNTINIDNNTLSNVQQQGIFLDMANTGAAASNINSRIVNNCIGKLRVAGLCTGVDAPIGLGSTIASGVRVDRRVAGLKQANVLIDGNTIRNGTAIAGSALNSPGIFARTQNDDTSSVTVTNNNVDTAFTGVAEMRYDTNNASATMCIDVNTNIVAAGLGTIAINETAGTLNVEQASAAALALANGIPAGNVTVTGTPQFGIACAVPPVAMLMNQPMRDYLAVRTGVKGLAAPERAKAQISRAANSEKPAKSTRLHHADRNGENQSAKQLSKALAAINNAGALNSAMVADVSLAIGTLPAGESVTITFKVTVDDPFTGSAAEVCNQGTVSGTNFASVATDDPSVGGAADPTCTPIDPPDSTVTVAVSPLAVDEDGATNLVYTFTRAGFTATPLTVNFSIGGTADFGASPDDYTQTGAATFTPPTGTVNFTAGSSTAMVTINPEADATSEPDETVILTVTSGTDYIVGSPSSATGTITNDDAVVTVAVAPASTSEGGAAMVYTFSRTGTTGAALTVNFSVGGTASFPGDYSQSGATTFTPPTATVTIGIGNASAAVTVTPLTDCISGEGPETVQFTVTAGTGYTVGVPSTAIGTINDVPDTTPPVITLDPNRPTKMWPPNHDYQNFTVSQFVQSASDNCDPNVDATDVYITNITSDEAEDGNGDGNTLNDITIAADCKSFQLRAERSVVGDGRVYTITFKVVDNQGNFTTVTATVTVGITENGPVVNSGPQYRVNSICP